MNFDNYNAFKAYIENQKRILKKQAQQEQVLNEDYRLTNITIDGEPLSHPNNAKAFKYMIDTLLSNVDKVYKGINLSGNQLSAPMLEYLNNNLRKNQCKFTSVILTKDNVKQNMTVMRLHKPRLLETLKKQIQKTKETIKRHLQDLKQSFQTKAIKDLPKDPSPTLVSKAINLAWRNPQESNVPKLLVIKKSLEESYKTLAKDEDTLQDLQKKEKNALRAGDQFDDIQRWVESNKREQRISFERAKIAEVNAMGTESVVPVPKQSNVAGPRASLKPLSINRSNNLMQAPPPPPAAQKPLSNKTMAYLREKENLKLEIRLSAEKFIQQSEERQLEIERQVNQSFTLETSVKSPSISTTNKIPDDLTDKEDEIYLVKQALENFIQHGATVRPRAGLEFSGNVSSTPEKEHAKKLLAFIENLNQYPNAEARDKWLQDNAFTASPTLNNIQEELVSAIEPTPSPDRPLRLR